MGKFASKQKNILLRIIHETAQSVSLYAKDPERDFTRKSPLCADTFLKLLVGMGGQSVNKELYSWFKPSDTRVTGSAFVQQRAKLLPEAFEYILNEYNFYSHDNKTYRGYHILAVDGTVMTYNGYESDSTWMPNSGNGCNQFHVNALFDILNHTYADVLIQPNPKQNEQKACWQMMERQSLRGKTICCWVCRAAFSCSKICLKRRRPNIFRALYPPQTTKNGPDFLYKPIPRHIFFVI